MIKCFENVLNKEEQIYAVNKTVFGNAWSFSGYTYQKDQAVNVFWYMSLLKDDFFSKIMFLKVKELIGEDLELLDVYANGQTHGLSGTLHIDSEEPNALTFLYYACPAWDVGWGGFTVFYTNNEVITKFPHPNSAVCFDSNILHYGLEPNRHCPHLRVTIAFKLKRKTLNENYN